MWKNSCVRFEKSQSEMSNGHKSESNVRVKTFHLESRTHAIHFSQLQSTMLFASL